MRAYSSASRGVVTQLREARSLYKLRTNEIARQVAHRLEEARAVEQQLKNRYGLAIPDARLLDVGCGQLPVELLYFGLRMEAIGLDIEIAPRAFRPDDYVRAVLRNGPRRVAKTAVRRMLGIDARYRAEFGRQLGVGQLDAPTIVFGDAENVPFGEREFAVVYSRAVFHHLSRPDRGLAEVARILRPGGVAWIGIHPFTSQTGGLDPAFLSGPKSQRPALASSPSDNSRRGFDQRVCQSTVDLGVALGRWPRVTWRRASADAGRP